MPETYESSQDLQTKMLALAVREPQFIDHYRDVMLPDYFGFDPLKMILRCIYSYFDLYKVPPTREALMDTVDQQIHRSRAINDRESILNIVDYLYNCDLSDGDYVSGQVLGFGRTAALKQAIYYAIEKIDNKDEEDYDDLVDVFQRALTVGDRHRVGSFNFGEFVANPRDYLRGMPGMDPNERLGTPWRKVNSYLKGGLGPGQLGIVMAAPGFGKSAALVNIAKYLVYDREVPTFYFAIGDLKEGDIGLRLITCLFGMSEDEIMGDSPPPLLNDRIETYSNRNHPIEIAYYSPSTVKVSALRSFISRVVAINPEMKPGAIIVDYADNVLPTRNAGKGTYLEMSSVYESLIELGDSFQCPIWTGSQPQRWGLSEEILDMEKVADSWKKIAHADAVITLNVSAEEKDGNRGRFYIAKSRRGISKKTIPYSVDFSRMTFVEH